MMRVRGPQLKYAIPRLREVENKGTYSNFGRQETELRERFADFLGLEVDCVATACNATVGLMGAVAIAREKNWTVPSFTFPASPASILNVGNQLSFADIGKNWWLNATEVVSGGAMPVAPFGSGVGFTDWREFDSVVFDAAASLGAPRPQWDEMGPRWAIVYSLHATKILGSGEGAILAFGSAEKAQEFRAWTNFGFQGSRDSDFLGFNGKMSEIQASFAHASLDDWPQEQEDWTLSRHYALEAEKDLGIEGVPWQIEGVNPYWIVYFESEKMARDAEKEMALHNIETRRWWGFGCHTMPAFQGISAGSLSKTREVASRTLGLPMYRGLGEREIERIRAALSRAIH